MTSDHFPITANISTSYTGIYPPATLTPTITHRQILIKPVKPQDLNNFKITSEAELQFKCCQLQQEMDLLDTDIINQSKVDSLNIIFQDILTNLEQIAHKTLKFKQITIGK